MSAQLMAAPVANYRTATVDVSKEITGEVNTLLIQIGVIAAAAVAASWLSFGGSLAAGTAGIAGTVTATVNTIRGLYQASRLYRLLGVTAVAATAVGVVKEFDALPDLNPISAALAGIIALRVNLDDDANPGDGTDDGSTSVAKTTEEKSQAVKDVVTDESGTLIGTEDATGVQMVSQKEVDAARTELTEKLGPPRGSSIPASVSAIPATRDAAPVTASWPANVDHAVPAVASLSMSPLGSLPNCAAIVLDSWPKNSSTPPSWRSPSPLSAIEVGTCTEWIITSPTGGRGGLLLSGYQWL